MSTVCFVGLECQERPLASDCASNGCKLVVMDSASELMRNLAQFGTHASEAMAHMAHMAHVVHVAQSARDCAIVIAMPSTPIGLEPAAPWPGNDDDFTGPV
jgi:3-hydroxyisobutyrate dehydrogenase-like beta-hydroxyacid dehydrogenase